METQQILYQNENRAIKLTLNISPNNAYTTIYDSGKNVIRSEQQCNVDGNDIWEMIGQLVTANTGTYYIVWKIIEGDNVYFHKTKIMVEAIL